MTEKIREAVLKNRALIEDAQNYIWANPETGYREEKTSKYMAERFLELGYELTYADGITGFYTVVDTGREGPEILVLGELDSLICFEHPDADPLTGAVHCCGHSAQCAALLGIAAALKDPDILASMCGRIRLCAVPAEELIEIGYRLDLRKKGIIKYFGGKTEFLYRGYFDGVDMAFMLHTAGGDSFAINNGSVGCVAKTIIYKGVSAHAGGSPWDGCNALYAANLGINAINAIRETFREPDVIRVHPIITKGGSAVNAIPDRVIMESYIRGSSFKAIEDANKRVNRALCGAALSIGANVDIQDSPGYAPYRNCVPLGEVFLEAARAQGEKTAKRDVLTSGSTDMGDLACVMPIIHGYAPGAVGKGHGDDYYIADIDKACVGSARVQVELLYALLKDNAARAKEILEGYEPPFASKKEYFEYLDRFDREGDRIDYREGKADVSL